MAKLSTQEYIAALEKIKKMPRDRIGILGDIGATTLGALLGGATAGTVASTAGSATLMGSTTLASLMSGIFVTTTPVGWVVGTAVAGGALGYGVARLVRSGGKSDARKLAYKRELRRIIKERKSSGQVIVPNDDDFVRVATALMPRVRDGAIQQEQGTQLLKALNAGKITADDVLTVLERSEGN